MKDKRKFKLNTYVRDEIRNTAQVASLLDEPETIDKTPEQEAQPPQGRIFSSEKKARIRLLFANEEENFVSGSEEDGGSEDGDGSEEDDGSEENSGSEDDEGNEDYQSQSKTDTD